MKSRSGGWKTHPAQFADPLGTIGAAGIISRRCGRQPDAVDLRTALWPGADLAASGIPHWGVGRTSATPLAQV